jgi:hypothetical protein
MIIMYEQHQQIKRTYDEKLKKHFFLCFRRSSCVSVSGKAWPRGSSYGVPHQAADATAC